MCPYIERVPEAGGMPLPFEALVRGPRGKLSPLLSRHVLDRIFSIVEAVKAAQVFLLSTQPDLRPPFSPCGIPRNAGDA